MNRWLQVLGHSLFWLAWPLFKIYLSGSQRTRVAIICGGRMLVTKNWLSDGRWSLPGGGRHRGEPARAAAQRELREETGINLSRMQLRLVGHYHYRQAGLSYEYDLFMVQLAKPPAVAKQWLEIAETAWLTKPQLQAGSMAPDVVSAVSAW